VHPANDFSASHSRRGTNSRENVPAIGQNTPRFYGPKVPVTGQEHKSPIGAHFSIQAPLPPIMNVDPEEKYREEASPLPMVVWTPQANTGTVTSKKLPRTSSVKTQKQNKNQENSEKPIKISLDPLGSITPRPPTPEQSNDSSSPQALVVENEGDFLFNRPKVCSLGARKTKFRKFLRTKILYTVTKKLTTTVTKLSMDETLRLKNLGEMYKPPSIWKRFKRWICCYTPKPPTATLVGLYYAAADERRPPHHQAASCDARVPIETWLYRDGDTTEHFVINGSLFSECASESHGKEKDAVITAVRAKCACPAHYNLSADEQFLVNHDTYELLRRVLHLN
jgi:hypothetical protein